MVDDLFARACCAVSGNAGKSISQKSRDYFNINLDNGFRIFTENQIILIKLKAIISTCTANLIYSCMLWIRMESIIVERTVQSIAFLFKNMALKLKICITIRYYLYIIHNNLHKNSSMNNYNGLSISKEKASSCASYGTCSLRSGRFDYTRIKFRRNQ